MSTSGWPTSATDFAVLADSTNPLISGNFFAQLLLAVKQYLSTKSNRVINITAHYLIKEHEATQFPKLLTRIQTCS